MKGIEIARSLLDNHDFRMSYDENEFWSSRISPSDMQGLFSWDSLNHCLSSNRITNDRFRMSTEREHDLVNKRAFRSTRDRFGRNTDYLMVNELHKLMREGVSAVLEAVNELAPSVEHLTEYLGGKLGAQSTANAYISFGDISGFGAHNDDHDVIVFQIEGKKKWTFFKTEKTARKATVDDLKSPSASDLGEEIIVAAGDIMFIPKGTWHDVVAVNERSLHLTVSIVYPTVVDFITWGMRREKYNAPYMDIRPFGSSRERVTTACREFFDALIDDENIEAFLKAFYAGVPGSRIHANFPSLNIASLRDSFRRIPHEVVDLGIDSASNNMKAFALGKIHILTRMEHGLLLKMSHVDATSGDALTANTDICDSTLSALQGLIDRGLIAVVEPALSIRQSA